MISLISIYFGGFLTLLMAFFHTRFYKLFKWEHDYTSISEINKKIFYTIHLALYLLFFGFSIITILNAEELSKCNGIAFYLNLLLALFWFWRFVWQIIYFKGKIMHFVLIVYFFLLFISYLIPILIKYFFNI